MSDVERFLEKFASFGSEPDPEKYEDLFDPDEGTVLHPGMLAPLPRNEVREYMANFLATIEGFRFEILSSADQDGTVFVEAGNRGTVGGEQLEWGTVYCVTLKGSRVLRGRAYADRIPILARLLPTATLAEIAGTAGPAPGLIKES